MFYLPQNTTFIGDRILIRYINTVFPIRFRRPDEDFTDIVENYAFIYQSAYSYEWQTIRNIQKIFTMYPPNRGYRFNHTAVIMLGTYDILDMNINATTRVEMVERLQDIIAFLRLRWVFRIVICTLPRLRGALHIQNETLRYYNGCLRILAAANPGFIFVVDLNAALYDKNQFEELGFMPNMKGFELMHYMLRPFYIH